MHGQIFRIEDEDGKGVYTSPKVCASHLVCEIMGLSSLGTSRHPEPYRDSLLVSNIRESCGFVTMSDYKFGFESIEKLRTWFFNDQGLKYLHECGLFISEYFGEVFHGRTQSVIDQYSMVLKRSFSILSLWEQ
jgi:hypothetical protein